MISNQHRLGRVLTAALGIALLSACGAQDRYASHLRRGQDYLAKEDLPKASVEFRNALQIQPKSGEALYQLGSVSERRGNLREAVAWYQAAIDAAPNDERARAALGLIFAAAGAPDRALQLVAPALARHPDDADLLTVRAAANMQLHKPDSALADAQHAVQVAPTNERAIGLLAGIYSNRMQPDLALAVVTDALKRQPQSVGLHELLAGLYDRAEQPEHAAEETSTVIRLQPRQLPPRIRLALYEARAHKLDDAQHALEEAVQALPGDADAKLALVSFIATQRSRAQGEKTLRSFIEREPANNDLRLGLGSLLERSAAPDDAVGVYNEIVKRAGTAPQGLIASDRIAMIRAKQGRIAEARGLVDAVLQSNPHDTPALSLRAELELVAKDPRSAVADIRTLLRDQPNSIELKSLLAHALLANGDVALAEDELRAAIQAAPNSVPVRLDLGQLLIDTRRPGSAVPVLEEAVRRAPSDIVARERLTRAYDESFDLEAARNEAKDLETLDPQSPVGFFLSGMIAQEQHRWEDAQRDLEHAVELQPNAIDGLSALARLHLARGDAAGALAVIQHELARDPNDARAMSLLGEVYIAIKDYPRATDTLTKATAIDHTAWLPYRYLGIARLGEHDVAGAVAAYRRGIELGPDAPQLTIELAGLLQSEGKVDDAIACYDALNRRNPQLVMIRNNLAMLLATYRKDRGSLDQARDLTAGFGVTNSPALLDTHGWVRFQRGEYQIALTSLERAVAEAPQSGLIRYHLAMAELQSGQKDRARQNLETALAGSTRFIGWEAARSALASLKGGAAG
jgi:tetratricopeptide (TPR) repeat protein